MLFCSTKYAVDTSSLSSSSNGKDSDEEFDPALNGLLRRRNVQTAAATNVNSTVSSSYSNVGESYCTMTNGGIFIRSLSSDIWYLVFTFLTTQWFFLNGRLVCREWFHLIQKRGVYSPKLTYYVSSKDVKKELKRCEKFVHLCREGYFKQVVNLTIHSDCLLENGGLLRLLFNVSNSMKEQTIMKGCNTKHVDTEDEINSPTQSPRESDTFELFGLNKMCKSCEKTLHKQTAWVNLLKMNIPPQTCFPKLTSLSLCYEYSVVKSIITSPFISSLTELNLGSGHVVSDDDLKEIVNTKSLSNLKILSLYHNLITEVGAMEIANCPHMSNLTSLELGLNRIGLNGFLQLVNSPILNNLTYLDVSRNEIKFNSIVEITNKKKIDSKLKTLILLKNDLGLNGSISFMKHARFPHLTQLNISATNLGSQGIKNISNSSLSSLTMLDAGYNNMGDEGVLAICKSPFLVNLQQLDLVNNRIGSAGAMSISNSLCNLTHLDVSNFGNENINQIGNEGAFSIASSHNMAKLRKLYLRRNNIGEEASKAIENSEILANLSVLDMRYNEVDLKRNKNGPRRTSDDSTCIIA